MGTVDIIGISLSAITTVAFGTMFVMILRRAIKEKKSVQDDDNAKNQSRPRKEFAHL
jgi:hypothetical protein